MLIGGLEKLSLIDYPGELSAVVFTLGCNFRCHYCYNPMLVKPSEVDKFKDRAKFWSDSENSRAPLRERDFIDFLEKRKGKLGGIVISGGEPTIQKDLVDFIKRIKKRGFLVKLDTNGTNPEIVKKLINKELVDYVAMDIKADEDNYSYVTGAEVDLEKIKESVKIIKESTPSYEFRTTLVPGLLGLNSIPQMGEMIKGAEKWCLQQFVPADELVDSELKKTKPFSEQELKEIQDLAGQYVKLCNLR